MKFLQNLFKSNQTTPKPTPAPQPTVSPSTQIGMTLAGVVFLGSAITAPFALIKNIIKSKQSRGAKAFQVICTLGGTIGGAYAGFVFGSTSNPTCPPPGSCQNVTDETLEYIIAPSGGSLAGTLTGYALSSAITAAITGDCPVSCANSDCTKKDTLSPRSTPLTRENRPMV